MSQKCSICKEAQASQEYGVKLHKHDDNISIDIPVCYECQADFKLLSQLLTMFSIFMSIVFSTIMLFMAWGYYYSEDNVTAVLFALSVIPIVIVARHWAKKMLRKSHFRRMSREHPLVVEKLKEGYE